MKNNFKIIILIILFVRLIILPIELIPSETEIAKAGVLDGARIAWADKLNVPESSISDQTALQGIIFL